MLKRFAIIIIMGLSGQLLSQSTDHIVDFKNDLKHRTFNYFWELVDTSTWQIPDRYPRKTFTSITATGFGLTSYIIGVENKYITREEAAQRVFNTLRWLINSKQGTDINSSTGYKGFYYHFLHYQTGTRFKNVELSTIDTGLLLAGILACQSYFSNENETERKIRDLADSIYLRVEWDWAMNNQNNMSMGWKPESGFLEAKWTGYNEAMILLLLALGSPEHTIPSVAWEYWCNTYQWSKFQGYEFVNFDPLFGHQYSHMFIDFRNIYDPYMEEKSIDYFENSRRATLSNRDYCIKNPYGFKSYSEDIWGLTACDGPANMKAQYNGNEIQFYKYRARGASSFRIIDDGTISITAAGGSIPFAPEICLDALYTMKNEFNGKLYQEYGFVDAFNASYTIVNKEFKDEVWINEDYIGINQGPILIQLANYENELIWNIMKKNKYIIQGLKKAGFTGGWLDEL